MNTYKKTISLAMVWLLAVQPYLITIQASARPMPQDAMVDFAPPVQQVGTQSRGVELTGEYVDRTAEMRAERDKDKKPGFAEDGTPYPAAPFAYLPVVDDKLSAKMRAAPESKEELRVIVHLDYLPHEQVFSDVVSAHQKDVDALESDRVALMEELKAQRVTGGEKDSDNYQGMRDMSDAQRAAMRAIHERHEALSLVLKNETTRVLRGLIDDSQAPVKEAIAKLGGNVEFSTIAGNMIIAKMPMNGIDVLAREQGILRIVEDSLMEGHLTVADESSMADPTDASLLGLWDNNQTGGIWDPAVIDSGMDASNPLLVNNAGRDNWCSWYLVAANGDANFGDSFTCDDLQGHGTHVAGIVASHGSGAYPGHLGMAFSAEKMVNLKAGWLNSSSGRASMYWSDKFNLVDRALFDNNNLQPNGTFLDDVEGFNLSYGGDTSLDDTDGGRFWDSVVSTINDTVVTISAGNSGPSNTVFSDPAVSYNAITVANLNDRNTGDRGDDIIRSSSTVGPTAGGRKKPDLAAPGTSIQSANNDWETQADVVNATGTSMAAPMVLGVLIDLMDAGILDELRLKSLIINTAQKNLTNMNFESDSDGWDDQIGWGAMNAYAAYFHRFDTFTANLAPRDTTGDFQLYMGTMRDEGAYPAEGRDRATMVWNRHATYNTAAAPTTYYNLVDLNIRLYRESNNSLVDSEFDNINNVHQVRINAGASPTDVVINAYAWSTSFSHGGATEQIALATEDGFTAVDHPSTFQGIAIWPSSVEPNEIFDYTFWVRNDSVLASHNNSFDLSLPAGWTLISGADVQSAGSA
ncbi:MAG: S8 family serine peptidase, partial [Gammaproteobacteria bacterium]|nr:S8 family serine peptidase [Gammaproteobacteria bacterium]